MFSEGGTQQGPSGPGVVGSAESPLSLEVPRACVQDGQESVGCPGVSVPSPLTLGGCQEREA